ncbi:MAG: phosphate ABC transporter permease subunit PstC [Deltaproteobacteria bacterium]|nr:phosphate ABC transporter permease subunit PstC [Deltaproteobacteria bacterium]
MILSLFCSLAALMVAAFVLGRRRAVAVVSGDVRSLHSRPAYYGHWVALWAGLPGLLLVLVWVAVEPSLARWQVLAHAGPAVTELSTERVELFVHDAEALAAGEVVSRQSTPELRAAAERVAQVRSEGRQGLAAVVLSVASGGLLWARRRIHPQLRARNGVERAVRGLLAASSGIAILVTIGIVLSLIFEASRFFGLVPLNEFLFGLEWSPQTAIRTDQVGSSGSFGAIPVFAGTLLITAIAMAVAVPVGLLSAIYLSDYASARARAVVKPLLEILAGIPTVVYGFFAALSVGPVIRAFGERMGWDVSSESALAAGLVMGVMIIPFVSSLSDDVINAVPQSLREASLGLGATPSETIRQVVLPAALPGIVSAILLAVSRAIGETMIVVMAAGLAANLTANPFEAVTTVTVQVVTLLVGDQEFDSAKTLAAFALGLTLFLVTLVLNVIAMAVVRRYREQYD